MSSPQEKAFLVKEKEASPPGYSGPAPAVVYQPQPQYTVLQPVHLGNPPDDQLIFSIFTSFCCFMPLGLLALLKSIEARNAYQVGHHEEAAAAIKSAKLYNRWSIIITVIITVVVSLFQMAWIIPTIVSGASSAKNGD